MAHTHIPFASVRPTCVEQFWHYPDDPDLRRLVRRLKSTGLPRLSIYHGPFGTGKTTMARYAGMYASCVNHKDGLPCGECKPCSYVHEERHVWRCAFHELDGTKPDFEKHFRQAIFDQDVNFYEEEFIYDDGPVPEWGLIYIDEAHRMTPKQQEQLLKPVEDDWDKRFILSTTQIDKIDGGLRSRAKGAIYRFKQPSPDQAAKNLIRLVGERHGSLEESVAYAITKRHACVPRDCLNELDELFSVSKYITPEVWVELYGDLPDDSDEAPPKDAW